MSQDTPVPILLPHKLGMQLKKMAGKREMTLNALVAELVTLGLIHLQYPEPERRSAQRGIDPTDSGYKI